MILILHPGLRTIALEPPPPPHIFFLWEFLGFPGLQPHFCMNSVVLSFVLVAPCGNGFLLFPGGVARFAFALRDVKFSEPLINGPKPTALQPHLPLSWQPRKLNQGQEEDQRAGPIGTG